MKCLSGRGRVVSNECSHSPFSIGSLSLQGISNSLSLQTYQNNPGSQSPVGLHNVTIPTADIRDHSDYLSGRVRAINKRERKRLGVISADFPGSILASIRLAISGLVLAGDNQSGNWLMRSDSCYTGGELERVPIQPNLS